ncbi:MAG: undecaprenyl-diphosphate phosphatase [Ruminococcaceae bacterium]|nr:undecaprenyl-diphosphate phosphatase [Oscillospiraceae bacterium]
MMLEFMELLKVIILGIVEGITEWLPISSTGHMLLVDEMLQLNASAEYKEMFFYVIQLGAILAVIVLFWKKMLPLKKDAAGQVSVDQQTISTWCKVVVACIPGGVAAILFDDWIEAHMHTPFVIALMLIIYGIAFLVIERRGKTPRIREMEEIDYRTALYIGLFQVLSMIPGTSRSGATIVGALLIGVSRVAAAEFTFFLAVPVMLGMSALKILKFGLGFSAPELYMMLLGMAVAFVVSLLVIRFLMNYIKKHDFQIFGWYRIVLGAIVVLWAVLQ